MRGSSPRMTRELCFVTAPALQRTASRRATRCAASPDQPFHASSGHSPRIGPNMLRPRMKAPKPSIARERSDFVGPLGPPSFPSIARKVRVGKNHCINSGPPLPSGCSRLCSGRPRSRRSRGRIPQRALSTSCLHPIAICNWLRFGTSDPSLQPVWQRNRIWTSSGGRDARST
jgi:hypothetical protein